MVKVEVVESELVAPMEETPKHGLWLSDLDLLTLRGYTPTIYYYRPNGHDPAFFSPATMKAALREALVPFYPLAGRLVEGPDGRLEIDCTGDGALFVVARSDSTLDELGEVVPSEETKRLLVPSAQSGEPPCVLLMFQVTFFKCGGVCLGAALHHLAVDGTSAIHFINTWSDVARGLSIASPPFIERTVLRSRTLPPIHPPPTGAAPIETAILKLTKNQVDWLKNGGGGKRSLSTFKAVAAHAWRAACMARGLGGEQETRLFMPVDLRSRLVPPLPKGYLGNAFYRVSAAATVGEIVANAIEFGAGRIQEALVSAAVVEKGGERRRRTEEGAWELGRGDVWVSSWLAMPIFELDFGWGSPAFMVRASIQFAGLMYLMRSPAGDGGVSLAVGFEPENMARFKKFLLQD